MRSGQSSRGGRYSAGIVPIVPSYSFTRFCNGSPEATETGVFADREPLSAAAIRPSSGSTAGPEGSSRPWSSRRLTEGLRHRLHRRPFGYRGTLRQKLENQRDHRQGRRPVEGGLVVLVPVEQRAGDPRADDPGHAPGREQQAVVEAGVLGAPEV